MTTMTMDAQARTDARAAELIAERRVSVPEFDEEALMAARQQYVDRTGRAPFELARLATIVRQARGHLNLSTTAQADPLLAGAIERRRAAGYHGVLIAGAIGLRASVAGVNDLIHLERYLGIRTEFVEGIAGGFGDSDQTEAEHADDDLVELFRGK